MKIKELKIGHFRNLSHQHLKFSNFTAIVGENGSGKSSILEVIAVLAMDIEDKSLEFEGIFEDSNGELISMDMKSVQLEHVPLTYFTSDRFINESSNTYCFHLKESLDKFTSIARDLFQILGKNLVKVDDRQGYLFFTFSDSSAVSLNNLGEGCRVFLSTIRDLLMVLEKEDLKPIVLIDELEIHFHPLVHRTLVEILKKYFSELQIIITTNSPVLISQLSKEEIRIIDKDSEVISCEYHTFGSDANKLLRLVFDTDERPSDVKKLFEQFSFLIADRNFPEAKEVLSRLKSIVGELDSEIVSCQVTLDLEQLDEKCFGDKHKKK